MIHERTGGGCRINTLSHLERAEAIFVIGANPDQSAPVLGYYLRRAARRGVPLIVADPRKTDLVLLSSLWLPVSPSRDAELINCVAALLWKAFAHDANFIEHFTVGFAHYIDGLSSFNPARLCLSAGIDISSMKYAAGLLKAKKIAFVVGHGVTQRKDGDQTMEALLNLSLMTGSLGSDAGGLYFPAKENNLVGALDMGSVPDALPGREPLSSGSARRQWERAWGVRLSPDQGLNMVRMIEEAEKGNLKALYVLGENPLRSLPQPERIRKALEGLDLLVVQDILTNETSQVADVVLPGAAFSEKGGSFTNMEGRIQSFEPVVPPPGDAKADWEIIDLLSEKMGCPKHYGSLERIRADIVQLVPAYAGLDGEGGVSWVKQSSKFGLFNPEGRGDPIPFSPVFSTEDEVSDDDYPFTAILGSLRYHLGSGTRTDRSARIHEFGLKGEIEISPEDGKRLNLHDGDLVRARSRTGSIVREIRIQKGLSPGLVFVPMAFNANDARNLIDLTGLRDAGSLHLKACQIILERPERG
ncbi:MAG: molybdopterin-dependent oxidoreductase [Thermodesulfobacteriota bacterium]|nr:molybdopterin-dependent oxidoreductase [Thermodesulfobacteriota bacterium]